MNNYYDHYKKLGEIWYDFKLKKWYFQFDDKAKESFEGTNNLEIRFRLLNKNKVIDIQEFDRVLKINNVNYLYVDSQNLTDDYIANCEICQNAIETYFCYVCCEYKEGDIKYFIMCPDCTQTLKDTYPDLFRIEPKKFSTMRKLKKKGK